MKHKYFLRTLLCILCLTNLQLRAQPFTEPVEEPLRKDYIYYPTEESDTVGASRFGVVLGTAIVAGALIGAVAVSVADRHYRGSQSANYSAFSHQVSDNIYSENYSNDVYTPFGNLDHIHNSGSSSGSSNSYSSKVDETQVVVVEKSVTSMSEENSLLSFEYNVEEVNGEDEITPYLESPTGVILGQSQYVKGPVHFPEIVVKNPAKGVYRAGFSTKKLINNQIRTVVKVITTENEQLILDESGLYHQ